MNYSQMASQLQSHLALRANAITSLTEWKLAHRAMGQMRDFRDAKQVLVTMNASQALDKRLLRMTQEMSYMDLLMKADYPEDNYTWLGGH